MSSVNVDAVLQEVGEFGLYQVYTYALVLLPILISAVHNSQYVFNAAAIPLRCVVPECESPPYSFMPGEWSSWALPSTGHCDRKQPLQGECTPDSFHDNTTVRCENWVYENQDSVVYEFGLACQDWKRTLIGTIHSVGMFFALPLTGYISDSYGRRTAFLLTAVAPGFNGLIRSFSNSYAMYLCFEFLDAVLGSGVYSTGFILALEMVGLNRRVLGGNLLSSFFALGQVLLALVAWRFPYWRTLTRILYLPSFLFIFYYFIIEESVRWLLSRGRKKEAARIIYKAAAMNKKELSPETIKELDSSASSTETTKSTDQSHISTEKLYKQVLKSKIILGRLCICSFWWITVTFIYYGLSINSVLLAGNRYVNFILTSLVEIPGYGLSVLTLDRFGRKSCIMTAFFICGFSLVGMPFVPEHMLWLSTSLNLLGKLCISMSFSSIYIYTSELFPTAARHSLLGFCSTIGRIGSITAPMTPLLMRYAVSLPYLIFGVMAGCSGMLMLLTPETLRTRLPDTIAQAENIASDQSDKAQSTRNNAS